MCVCVCAHNKGHCRYHFNNSLNCNPDRVFAWLCISSALASLCTKLKHSARYILEVNTDPAVTISHRARGHVCGNTGAK